MNSMGAHARTARASPEERCDSAFLIELYGDHVGGTKVLKSLSEWTGGGKTLTEGRLRPIDVAA